MLTASQLQILSSSGFDKSGFTAHQIIEMSELTDCSQLSLHDLLAFLKIANALYRAGEPLITDSRYDHVFLAELQRRDPENSYLAELEPEAGFVGKTVQLPVQMLSTDKAYTLDSIKKWLERIAKTAQEIDLQFSELLFRCTPKLDGYAAYDDGEKLYTRGDGRKGTDISRVFERGLIVAGNTSRGQGAGEVVVKRSYFNEFLADEFDNARNFQASIIKEKDLDEHALAAIKNHAAVFYPFAQLPDWKGTAAELLADFENIVAQIRDIIDYDVDGIVIEVTHEQLKQAMGATRHHHRWQIAFKNNAETVEVEVINVTPQTSRSGRVNPVAELQPTRLSGALISRATAHHYGMVQAMGIGAGALIELTRSGLVIPKIERVIKASQVTIPEHCPSCGADLFWDNDYLFCPNSQHCPAQIENTIEHFFKTLGNVDGFGAQTVKKLHQAGVKSVLDVYRLKLSDLQDMGFGDKTAQNLLDQLARSRTEAIEDWRFLGAFGIHRMGLGNCERLLMHYPLQQIFDLSIEDIVAIEGFAEKTAESLFVCLKKIVLEFNAILELGFNLNITPIIQSQPVSSQQSKLFGKVIVFTGTMKRAKRDDMKKDAKKAGAKVAASVTGNTDYLVAGEKTGAAKLEAAREKSVTVLSEDEYLQLFNHNES